MTFAGALSVTLFVADVPESVDWYRTVLGFGLVGYWDERSGCLVRTVEEADDAGHARLYAGEVAIGVQAWPGRAGDPAAAFELEVEDFERYLEQVQEQGGYPDAPEVDADGTCRFRVVDPFGYTWVFRGTAAPPRPPARPTAVRTEVTDFLTLEDYRRAAAAAQLALPDYFDKLWDSRRHARHVFERLAQLGAFSPPPAHVLELGTGAGLFTEQYLARHRPAVYESYEPSPDWAAWLAEQYGVLSRDADGMSLRHTADASVDYLHAHNVFVALLFLTSIQYFREIARVVRPGGLVAFDILSEVCLDDATVDAWLATDLRWPCFLSSDYVRGSFERQGFTFVGDFLMGSFDEQQKCFSQYLVFRKR